MELLGFGFLIGVVTTIIFIGVGRITDDFISERKSNNGNSVRSCDNPVDKPDRDGDLVVWPYDKGSEEEEEALGILAHKLYVMRQVTGLCQTEKESLDKAISYIKREIND